MSEDRGSKQIRQRLVMGLVDYMKKNNWVVTHAADTEGYPNPPEISGRTPDVVAKNAEGYIAIGEAETCETLGEKVTEERFDVFSDLMVTAEKKIVPFFVVVPASCIARLESMVNSRYAPRMERITCVKMAGI